MEKDVFHPVFLVPWVGAGSQCGYAVAAVAPYCQDVFSGYGTETDYEYVHCQILIFPDVIGYSR